MKTAIKLAFIYLGFQLLGMIFGSIIGVLYSIITTGTTEAMPTHTLALTLFFGIAFMSIYLWKAGYISKDKVTWSPVSLYYLALSIIIWASVTFPIDYLLSLMKWLPNILEDTFSTLQAGWLGIICIALLGPILEELLFRGAITKKLLEKYSPKKAIILSALIFGIIHINPIQVISATLIGLLLAWIYYKTASLIPCILIHVINNSFSVYTSIKYPDLEYTSDLFTNTIYIGASIIIFGVTLYLMKNITINYPWKKNEAEINNEGEIITNN